MLKSYCHVLVIIGVSQFAGHDLNWWVGTILVVMASYSMRIMHDYGRGLLTPKNALIQFITTISLCFISYIFWRDIEWLNKKIPSFPLFVAPVSFFALTIVSATIEVGDPNIKLSIRERLKRWLLGKEIANTDKE